MNWRPLAEFRDPAVPKLNNLRRATAAGIRVPPTIWAPAADCPGTAPVVALPFIIRSGSPTEDTRTTSNAGQLLSLVVHKPEDFPEALRRVIEAMPTDHDGERLGAVFVQPWLRAEEAGVAFCDGFYFERTVARGGNEALTSGQARGEVTRGTLGHVDPWSRFMRRVYDVFAEDRRIDIEFARDADGYVLLQSRPALFPVKRNRTLSLTNHKEILGDPPSPWLVSVLAEGGRDLSFMAKADPAIAKWDEVYAVELGARAWMNLSYFHRWLDHFGLPRSFITRNFGGVETADDKHLNWRRFLPSIPRLFRFQFQCLCAIPTLPRQFRELDAVIARATSLPELRQAMIEAGKLALRANMAINPVLAGVFLIRKLLRIPGKARTITEQMMEDYRHLAALPPEEREAGLDAWLQCFGHRGPWESDPIRPRFGELRDVLLADVMAMPPMPSSPSSPSRESRLARLTRIFFLLDERREWLRDQMMRRWQTMREKILAEARRLVAAGELDRADDAFFLKGEDLTASRPLRESVRANRAHFGAMKPIDFPITASEDELRQILAAARPADAASDGQRSFRGIALTSTIFEGVARKADDLTALLAEGGIGPETILVVPSLEPSWAVVFPRVGGVVADVGGEMSHASILLREARKPAVVNCTGIFRRIKTGDRLRLDGASGLVTLESGTNHRVTEITE